MSGQYEELLTSSGWYSDSNCTSKVELNSNGLPVSGVISDLDLYAKPKTYVLKKGYDFKSLIPSTATSVVFTDETMPASAVLIDVDADGDGGAVAWMDDTTMKVSTQIKGLKAQANSISTYMFSGKSNLKNIDLIMLDIQRSQVQRSQTATVVEHGTHICNISGIQRSQVQSNQVSTIVEYMTHIGNF